MYAQLFAIVFISLLSVLLAEQGLRGTKNIARERPNRKHGHSKPKLHYSTSLPHKKSKYGVELPGFSFDYSEFFTGAVIERSNESEDLFLNIFVLGHKSVSTDFPFHAISTDEEVLNAWSKAATKWTSLPTDTIPKSSSHTPSYSSGLACVVRNNDGSASQHVYQTSAYWVNSQYEKDGSSAKNTFSMLRCRLRNGAYIYANTTFNTNQEVFVDIMRLNEYKRPLTYRNATNSNSNSSNRIKSNLNRTGVAAPGGRRATAGEVNIASDARGVVLVSFSMPWATRSAGYPQQQYPYPNASNIDLWSTDGPSPLASSALLTAPSTTTTTTTTATATANTITSASKTESSVKSFYPETPSKHSTLLCVPGIRPLHPHRAEVGLPMLIEFIEHHLEMGFSHISLGLDIDGLSGYMTKHVYVLQQYIQAGLVSLHTTSLPGFNDVPGFAGVQLHDAVSHQFFLNQCLYLAKGLTKYVSVLRADEFLIPYTTKPPPDSGQTSFISTLLENFEKTGANLSSTSDSSVSVSHCSFALTPNGTDTHSPGTVVGQLQVFGVEDPANSFGDWGPAESAWSRDFFASSIPKALHTSVSQSLRFFPTDRVVRIEVSSSGHIAGYCRHGTNYHRGSGRLHRARGMGSGTTPGGELSPTDTSGSVRAVRQQYTATVKLPSHYKTAALFVYKSGFPAKLLASSDNPSSAESAALLKNYLASRENINTIINANLKKRGLSSIKEVKGFAKEAAVLHSQRHIDRANIHDDLAHHIARTAAKATTGINVGGAASANLPGRADIKAPFWQLCDTDYLHDVIKRVFHPHV